MAEEFTEETLQALTLLELQQELRKRGLRKSGPKPKLVQRLIEVRHFIEFNCKPTKKIRHQKFLAI